MIYCLVNWLLVRPHIVLCNRTKHAQCQLHIPHKLVCFNETMQVTTHDKIRNEPHVRTIVQSTCPKFAVHKYCSHCISTDLRAYGRIIFVDIKCQLWLLLSCCAGATRNSSSIATSIDIIIIRVRIQITRFRESTRAPAHNCLRVQQRLTNAFVSLYRSRIQSTVSSNMHLHIRVACMSARVKGVYLHESRLASARCTPPSDTPVHNIKTQ